MKFTLCGKLITMSMVLVWGPLLIMGGRTVLSVGDLGRRVTSKATEAIEQQACQNLDIALARDHTEINAFLEGSRKDAIRMASSPQMTRWLANSSPALKPEVLAEILRIHRLAQQPTAKGPQAIYDQIRVIQAGGRELIVLKGDVFQEKLGTRAKIDWFEKASQTPPGGIYVTDVELALNTGEPEMRVCSPVYVEGVFKALVVLNIKWGLTREILSSHVYGKTGYPYLINRQGVVVTHPKFTLKDHLDTTDPKYGKLSEISRQRMIQGQSGQDRYDFQGIDKLVTFRPLPFGQQLFVLAVTCPVQDFTAMVDPMKEELRSQTYHVVKLLGWLLAIMGLGGCLVGILFGRRVSRPIKMLIEDLRVHARETSEASAQMAEGSQELAQGASEQASALSQTNSSLEEMNLMTRKNAEVAQNGQAAMEMMLSAMREIQSSSAETSRIIKVIDEIAFQTNLLSLNAAVEAARAGDAGNGFAVVAQEVRSLAHRSAQAARNTSEMIQKSVQSSQNGAAIAQSVSKVLSQISQASSEHARGIKEVCDAVINVDKVTQQSAASAEGFATTAEELSQQAAGLQRATEQLMELVEGSA